jgi:hypothetical protein
MSILATRYTVDTGQGRVVTCANDRQGPRVHGLQRVDRCNHAPTGSISPNRHATHNAATHDATATGTYRNRRNRASSDR